MHLNEINVKQELHWTNMDYDYILLIYFSVDPQIPNVIEIWTL
jgi:hypothetical protein